MQLVMLTPMCANMSTEKVIMLHCIKSVRIGSYSGPNTGKYEVSLCIQSECLKMQSRITPNANTFHAVLIIHYNMTTQSWLKAHLVKFV